MTQGELFGALAGHDRVGHIIAEESGAQRRHGGRPIVGEDSDGIADG